MKFQTILELLFAIVLSFEAQAAKRDCETKINPNLIGVERVVRAGIGVQAIHQEDLSLFVNNELAADPFGASGRRPENLALRQRFFAFWNSLSLDLKRASRASLSKILSEISRRNDAIDGAREESARFINLQVVQPLEAPPGSSGGSLIMSLGWYEGRPVLQTSYGVGNDSRKRTDILYDPFQSGSSEKSTPLPSQQFEGLDPHIVETGGKSYASFVKDGFYFDLGRKRPSADLKKLADLHSRIESHQLVRTPRGQLLFVALTDPKVRYQTELVEINLSRPGLPMRTIGFGNFRHFQEFKWMDKHFLKVDRSGKHIPPGHSEFCILRIPSAENEVTSLIDCIQVPAHGASVFEHNGRVSVAYQFEEEDKNSSYGGKKYSFRTRELGVSKVRVSKAYDFGEYKYLELEGLPYFAFRSPEGLRLLDIGTMEEEILSTGEAVDKFEVFVYRGRALIWFASFGKLRILDPRSKTVLGELEVDGAVGRFIPFEYRGDIYAFVGMFARAPYLIRVTGTDEESE